MQHHAQPREIASTPHATSPDVFIAAQLAEQLRHAAATVSPHLAQAAWQLTRIEAWKRFGFSNAQDFARERLDHSGRWLRDLARLGQALHEMPALADALAGADGAPPLGRTAALEICRIARPETLDTWVQRARQCTIRALKEWIRQERSAQDEAAAASAMPPAPRGAWRVLNFAVPDSLPAAFDEVEQVFLATNAGGTRAAFVEALLAEQASALDGALPPAPTQLPSRPGRRRRLRRVDLKPGAETIVSETMLSESRSNEREILLARWALQHLQMFVEEMNAAASKATTSEAAASPESALRALEAALAIERELILRLDQLLLWLDNRNAWGLLDCADATAFGERVLDESSTTTRNRLRIARALEKSAALRNGVESGDLSHQRMLRIARLMQRRSLSEVQVTEWVAHASRITIKRLDDELRSGERQPATPAAPKSDADWFASLRRAPGQGREFVLRVGLEALAGAPVANVFLRLNLHSDLAHDLRQCLNQTRTDLQARCQRLRSAADEVRLFPSIRLAHRCVAHSQRIPDWICLLALLEEFAEEWDNTRSMHRRPTDTITSRDGWRCTAPGCTARQVEVHHVVYQSQGGSDDPSNLTSLCPFHPRMGEHGGLAKVIGTAPLGLRWRLGRAGQGILYSDERALAHSGNSSARAHSPIGSTEHSRRSLDQC